jgi:CHAT domain-containing protein
VPPSTFADLYYSLGVCYNKTADFSEAKIYFDKTYAIVKKSGLNKDDNFINLMNGLALTCNSLGMKEETEDYYEQGTRLAISNNSSLALNMINSYCVFLAENGKAAKGEKLLENALARAKTDKEIDLRSYFEVLKNYAGYLSEYKIDIRKALKIYELCIQYLKNNNHDLELITSVNSGYAHALEETGELDKALAAVQSLLFSERAISETDEEYGNPTIESLKPDRATLKILRLKYDILWDIYNKKADLKTLAAVASTGELIVSLLDKVRININEDESRFILGDKYRQSYLNLICDLDMLYKKTSDRHFLEKAFEYSEKSKAAGLLTSTRELKAVQFNIPSGIADYERELQREISLLNAKISEESASKNPDMTLIGNWKENLLDFSRKRDSLVKVFEKQYPEYYAIKYNTHMAGLNTIPDIIGKEGNYINYVVSDTVLYIFVVNKIHQQLLAIHIDSSFFNDIRRFRSLLAMPSPSEDALSNFKEFQNTGYRLYRTLIEPVRSYLISNQVFISPDNILSYLPFETIPESVVGGEGIRYNAINYLMNDFDISYTYSATFMAESEKYKITGRNKLIAFAPDYPEPINIQSALKSRQSESGVLNDLPYARQEAKYVADITNGTLFSNNAAKESVYKKEAGKYDIIHLAMHTLLNDKDPMHSTLIFSQKNDSPEDGFLKTYEIYGIPLKAKMVVLSSCNTGTGQLFSGEGILSLARGFIYSGSQSVIMSMWEIEDKSGTEIVKMFYQNLKKGESKSIALKNARIKFLKNADQLRSHPYFWSALVIYGDNTPLYHTYKPGLAIGAVLILLLVGFYYWKRKYS